MFLYGQYYPDFSDSCKRDVGRAADAAADRARRAADAARAAAEKARAAADKAVEISKEIGDGELDGDLYYTKKEIDAKTRELSAVVTQSSNGLMLASDKKKLDGLSADEELSAADIYEVCV